MNTHYQTIGQRDRLSENIDEAFSKSGRRAGIIVQQHETVANLIHDIVADERKGELNLVYEQEAPFLIYDWDGLHTREKALVLGLEGYYSLASTILRGVLESNMKGIFFNLLLRERFRESLNPSNSEYHEESLRGILSDLDDGSVEGAAIYDLIENEYEDLFKLQTSFLRDELYGDICYLDPIDKRDFIELYHDLSKSVHRNLSETIPGRNVETGDIFRPPSYDDEEFTKFAERFRRLMDTVGVMYLNVFETHIQGDADVRRDIEESNYELPHIGLWYTQDKIESICDYDSIEKSHVHDEWQEWSPNS